MTDPIRVLHVEDDSAFADLTARFLEHAETAFDVTAVETVADARDWLVDEEFDCVISDFDLPDENGLALLRWLRAREPDLPFVLFTAKGSEEVASEAISAGVTDYLQKAGGSEQYELLAHRVENVVGRYQTERAFDRLHRITDLTREVSQALVRASNREEIDQLVCERIADSESYSFAWIGDLDPGSGAVVPRAWAGIDPDDLDAVRHAPSTSATGRPVAEAIRSGRPQVVQDVRVEESSDQSRDDSQFRSVGAVPLVHADTCYGVLAVYADRRDTFGDRELAVLTELGDTVATAYRSLAVQEELATSERNYREVFDKVNDAIFVHDIETGEIEDVNAKACEMIGYDREDLLELTVGDFSRGDPPYTQEQAVEWIRKAAMEGPQLFEWAARRRNGAPFWMEVNLKRAIIGDQDRILAVVRDATRRKEMETELEAGREKIEGLLAAASRMETCETESEIYEMAVEVAEGILAFDLCVINVAGEEFFDIVAVSREMPSDGTQRMRLDEGLIGATYQSGEPRLVEEVHEDPDSKPARDEYRSAISVPVGDFGVLQAVATEPGWFDREDVELAELLVTHVKEAVERVRSRRTIEKSEEKFRKLFHNANDAIFLVDVSCDCPEIVEVNDVACERLGYDREELCSMRPADLEPGGTLPSEAHGVLEEGNVTFESVHVTSDGTEVPVEINAHLFELRGEEHVLAIARDVSERREREATLDALHAATRRLIRSDSPEEIADTAVEAAKDALQIPLAAVLGYDEDDDALKPLAATPEMADLFGDHEEMTWCREEGVPWRAFDTETIQHVDEAGDREGLRVDAEEVGSAIDLPLGDHGVLLIGSDPSRTFDDIDVEFAEILAANTEVALDRAARERLLREREAELRVQRDQFAALFENVPDPAVVTRFDGDEPIVDRVNPAFESVFGYDAEEIVGRYLDEHVVPDDVDEDPVPLNRQSTAGKVVRKEVRRQAADGVRDFLLHGVPIDVGEPNSKAFGIYNDITEQKRRESELARQNEQLEEFASIVSHDIRNPLNAAQGYLELAREDGSEEHFERVAAAHDRMERLIEGVLTLAREGRTVGDSERVDLESVVETAWSAVSSTGATLEVGELGHVGADEERVVRLFENLFRNSIEHAGPTATVRVGRTDDGFFVADDGPGIPAENRAEIFEYGYTSDEDGTGFGLAIVEQIASGHGWDVEVTDAEDGGARFEITF